MTPGWPKLLLAQVAAGVGLALLLQVAGLSPTASALGIGIGVGVATYLWFRGGRPPGPGQ